MCQIAVSLHSGPKLNLEKVLKDLASAHADFLHIDVMDGHFVPEIDFGQKLVQEISQNCQIPLDIHMMVEKPETLIDQYAFPTTEIIGIHVESTQHIHRILTLIKKLGRKSEVIINPGTSVSTIVPVLRLVDQIMVMSVDPGTSGARFIDTAIEKVKLLDDLRTQNNYHYQIEADGSIDDHNIVGLTKAGLDIAVVGSFVFKDNLAGQITKLKSH